MSIITKVEPQDIQPTYNKNIFVLDSTNKAKDKFIEFNVNILLVFI